MAIPEKILEEIQEKTDIVSLISSYIPLKKSGRNFKALCPFHSEKTPSFFVNPQRQIFHCFGCGAGGGSIQFLMQIEKISFVEAVEILAKKLGITIPRKDLGFDSLKNQAYSLNKEVCLYFYRNLFQPQGKKARDYLKERGLNPETIEKFKLGYATSGFKNLIEYTRGKNISLSLLDKLGLVSPTQDGSFIDLFRDRIMFPIFDVKDRVIGFGGRKLSSDENVPKYINTPESILYHKGKNLFGINFARDAILKKDCCIIVEGYFDQIIPYQAGIENIVASLGTALTVEQIRLIKRYTNNVVLIFDSDSAGKISSLRAIDLMIEEDLNVKLVALPSGFDPDSFVRVKGKDSFLKLIEEAKDFFFYKLDVLLEKFNSDDIQDKSKILLEMLNTLSKFNNSLIKYEYLKKLAERLKTKEEFLLIELKKIEEKSKENNPWGLESTIPKQEKNLAEEYLLRSILYEPKLIEIIKGALSSEDFTSPELKKLFQEILNYWQENNNFNLNKFIARLEDDLASCLSRLSLEEFQLDKNVFEESLLRIKKNSQKIRKEALREKIKMAEEARDYAQLNRLVSEYQNLIKEEKLR